MAEKYRCGGTGGEELCESDRARSEIEGTPAPGRTRQSLDLLTFRIAAVATKVAAGCVLKLALAFGAFANKCGHLVVDVVSN